MSEASGANQTQSQSQSPQQMSLQQQQQQQQRTAEARAAFVASLHSVGSHADAALQSRAEDISANAAVLAKQEADVQKETAGLAKQTDAFGKLAEEASDKLKELGDVQNWAEMLERDLLVLEETMRIVDEEGKDVARHGHREEGQEVPSEDTTEPNKGKWKFW